MDFFKEWWFEVVTYLSKIYEFGALSLRLCDKSITKQRKFDQKTLFKIFYFVFNESCLLNY